MHCFALNQMSLIDQNFTFHNHLDVLFHAKNKKKICCRFIIWFKNKINTLMFTAILKFYFQMKFRFFVPLYKGRNQNENERKVI